MPFPLTRSNFFSTQEAMLLADTQAQNLGPEKIIAGDLEVLLARGPEDIAHAQDLRYRVFVEEMGAKVPDRIRHAKRDYDEFDAVCDHLLVIDHSRDGKSNPVVGTYRLLRRNVAKQFGRFYSESEFDISKLATFPDGEVLELGRSCVDANYRNRSSMQLLWRGIGAYLAKYDISLMFGCASFNGTDVEQHREALSYLYHHHAAPANLKVTAQPEYRAKIDYLPKEKVSSVQILTNMPPLVKGYLRLGCYIGEGAAVDTEYNCIDVCIILPTGNVTGKYASRYTVASE